MNPAKARLLQTAAQAAALAVELELVYRGFAAPVNPRRALLALIAPAATASICWARS